MTAVAQPELTYSGPHPDLFFSLPTEQQRELLETFSILETLPDGLSVTVGNLKGGVSKTTTVMYLALMLGLTGDSVLVVDGDATNRSALLWQAATADWPGNVKVVSWAGEEGEEIATARDMVKRVRAVRQKFKHLVIDTGPQMRDYLAAALKLTTDFIVCSSAYPLDTQQIPKSIDLAAEVEAMKDDPLYVTVLFSRVKRNTNSVREAYADLREKNISVFDTAISALEGYALSAGAVPDDFREYVPVFRQLVEAQLPSDEELGDEIKEVEIV